MRTPTSLGKVSNRQGRVDVLAYRLAERWLEQLETKHDLVGLREHLLPLIEAAIVTRVPRGNVIPQELRALMIVCDQNLRRRGC